MDDLRTLEEARRWLRKMWLDGGDLQLHAIERDAIYDVLLRFEALVKRAQVETHTHVYEDSKGERR